MSERVVINTIEELLQFVNDKGVLEVYERDKKGRAKDVYNIILDKLSKHEEEKERLNKVLEELKNNTQIVDKGNKLLATTTQLSKFNLILSGVSLCATIAGFKIISDEITGLSSQIDQIIELQKKSNDNQARKEFTGILMDYKNMLDRRKNKKEYSEQEMLKLVNREYEALGYLIDSFLYETCNEISIIKPIFYLMDMLTASIKIYDEIYYFEYKDNANGRVTWHISHSDWEKIYNRILSKEFISRIQDYGMFTLNLNTFQTDAFYINLADQAFNALSEIKDNQKILVELDDPQLVKRYKAAVNAASEEEIRKSFEESGAYNDEAVAKICREAVSASAV